MAQHAILTNKSNQRIAAAVAVSGLVGTGLAVPFAQVALAVPNPCTVNYDGSNDASGTTLRNEIDAAIANVNCSVVEINNTIDEPLELEVDGSPIYVGPAVGLTSADPRTAITIKSTTGLNISPADGFSGSLMRLEESTSWSLSSSSFTSCSVSASESCVSDSFSSYDSGTSIFSNITIEGLTFRDSDLSAIDGLSFGEGQGDNILEIKNSRFVNNNQSAQFASERGGAVNTAADDVVISNSSFVGNYALSEGGAIRTYGTAWISNSLFVGNSTVLDGGAVYAGIQIPRGQLAGSIYAVNSSFVDNSAGERGGALFTYLGETELVLNTFFSNDANTNEFSDPLSPYSQEAVFGNATTKLWGNIFGNDSWTPSEVDDLSEDLGFNIFMNNAEMAVSNTTSRKASLDELAFEYDLRAPNAGDAYEAEIMTHASASTPVTTAPAFRITSSSVAGGFVKAAFPDADFNDFFNDKISVDQLGTSRGSSVSAGAHQVSVRRSSGGTAAVVATPITPKEALVPGFAPNSTKLTKSMKKEIRAFLKANPDLKNVVCKGFTSSPSTPQDRALARKRGKVACDYILTLRPDAQVTIRSGSHTNKPGSQIRRVNIKLS